MSFLDFLFEGQPPKSVTTTGQTTTSVPQWMQEYAQGILQRANVEAAGGYQPYEGARIAGMTPTQQAAFSLTKNNVGSAKPAIEQAMGIAGGMPGQGALTQALNYLPGAAEEFPDAAARYMNPYTENVINKAKNTALDAWKNEIMPGIEGQFVRNGVYGSSAHARALGRAGNTVTQNIQDTADAALAQGYESGANIFNQDQSRKGTLAQIAGQLGSTQASVGDQNARTLADLGTTLHATNAQDAAALESVGQQEQGQTQKNLDLAYNDFLTQQGWNKDQINWLSGLLNGSTAVAPQTTQTAKTGPLGNEYAPSTLSQVASIISAWKGLSGDKGG